jgi:hypothetical protein
MKKLDRNRKYGMVYGHAEAKFMQDGTLFNGAGYELGFSPEPESEADDKPQVVEQTSNNAERIAMLNKMAIPKLRKLVDAVAGQLDIDPPEGGKGAKARYVKFLVDNTTE